MSGILLRDLDWLGVKVTAPDFRCPTCGLTKAMSGCCARHQAAEFTRVAAGLRYMLGEFDDLEAAGNATPELREGASRIHKILAAIDKAMESITVVIALTAREPE